MPPYQEKVEAFIEELLFPVCTEKSFKEKHRNLEVTLSETSDETEEENYPQLDLSEFEVAGEVSNDIAYSHMMDAYPLATEYYTYPTNSKLASKQQQHVVTVNSMYDQKKARAARKELKKIEQAKERYRKKIMKDNIEIQRKRDMLQSEKSEQHFRFECMTSAHQKQRELENIKKQQQLQQQLRQQMEVELQLRREQMTLQLKRERMMAAASAPASDTRSCRTHRTHQSMSALPVRRSNYIAPKRNSYNVNNRGCNNGVANSSRCDSSTDSMDSSNDGYYVETLSDKFEKLLDTVVDGISSSLAPSEKKRRKKKNRW
jgi:hypothetical protein